MKGLPAGSQPLLNWKLKEFAAHRRESDPNDLLNDTDPPPLVPAIPKYPGLHQEAAPRWAALSAKARAGDPDLVVPAAERARYEAAFARFASVFPDAFYVQERGRYFPDDSEDKGRLLSAGYHNTMGYFRDDTPLIGVDPRRKGPEGTRPPVERVRLHRPATRSAPGFNTSSTRAARCKGKARSRARLVHTDHEITDAAVIMGMREAYLAKADADPKNDPVAFDAIRDHFDRVNTTLRSLEKERTDAEPKHLEALLQVRRARLPPAADQGRARRFAGLLPHAARQERAVA